MEGPFFRPKFFPKKAGFLAQKHGDSEGTFLQKKFLKKFRGKWPFSNLYMRGLFLIGNFHPIKTLYVINIFVQLFSGQMAVFQAVSEGSFF